MFGPGAGTAKHVLVPKARQVRDGSTLAPVRALVVTNMWPSAAAPQRGSFVRDQVEALRRRDDVEVDVLAFPPGPPALARALATARARTRERSYDVVHAHFGLSALPGARRAPRARGRHAARQRPLPPPDQAHHAGRAPLLRPAGDRVARVQPEPAGRRRVAPGRRAAGGHLARAAAAHPPRGGARSSRPRSRRPLSPLPARSVAAAQAGRPGARGGRRRAAAHDGPGRPRRGPVLDQRGERGARAVAGRGVRAVGDRGAGVRRARVRDAGRDPSRRAVRAWRARTARRGTATPGAPRCGRTSRRPSRGWTAARGPSCSRPTGWPRAWWRPGARWRPRRPDPARTAREAAGGPPILGPPASSPRRHRRAAMNGLLRRMKRSPPAGDPPPVGEEVAPAGQGDEATGAPGRAPAGSGGAPRRRERRRTRAGHGSAARGAERRSADARGPRAAGERRSTRRARRPAPMPGGDAARGSDGGGGDGEPATITARRRRPCSPTLSSARRRPSPPSPCRPPSPRRPRGWTPPRPPRGRPPGGAGACGGGCATCAGRAS